MSTAIMPYAQQVSMAEAIVKSGLFGIKTKEQALALFALCEAEGKHPATAIQEYHIIQGRPALRADAMLARFQAAGGVVEWVDYTDAKVSGMFSHPTSCPKPVKIEWTLDMAKRIGLAKKDNWANYPRQMLRSRVISEGVRTCHPGIAVGIYTVEEVQDFAPERDITPTAGAFASLPAKRQEIVSETAALIRCAIAEDRMWDAHGLSENSGFDADETAALSSLLGSGEKRALMQIRDAEVAQATGTISPAQKKRLEARIKELGLEREEIKAHCVMLWGVEHFSELTPEQYRELDAQLDAAPQGAQNVSPPSDSPAAAATVTDDSIISEIGGWIKQGKFDIAEQLAKGMVDDDKREKVIERIAKRKAQAEAVK